jgi:hypothetical protein
VRQHDVIAIALNLTRFAVMRAANDFEPAVVCHGHMLTGEFPRFGLFGSNGTGYAKRDAPHQNSIMALNS